jgi:hypothetical protein
MLLICFASCDDLIAAFEYSILFSASMEQNFASMLQMFASMKQF